MDTIKRDSKKINVTELIECQYQTVTVRKIREEVITSSHSAAHSSKVEDILKRIVPTKSFLYRNQNQPKKLDKTPMSYVPMDVGKKPRKLFRLSYDYPSFDLSRFRTSKQDSFNDRGYYSVKTTTVNKNNAKVYNNVESRTKYRSFSNTEDFNEIVLEDHFYEDLCYNDVEKKDDRKSRSISQLNMKSTAAKLQEMFNLFKMPSFFKKDASKGGEAEDQVKEEVREVGLYENEDVGSGSVYDSVMVTHRDVVKSDSLQPSKVIVEDYLEPVQLQKDYCDVMKEKDNSILGYILGIFENTFRIRQENGDQSLSEDSEETTVQKDDPSIKKWNENRKSGKSNMADRPLPVPVDNEPYYMNIERSEAEQMLTGHPDGTFILRPSSQPNHAYTLSVACNGAVHNVGVRRRPDGRLALGFARRGERSFATIPSLLRHHRRRRLLLVAGGGILGSTTLKEPPIYYQTPSSLPIITSSINS